MENYKLWHRLIGSMLLASGVVVCASAPGAAESGSTATPPVGHPSIASKKAAAATPVKLVDINSASAKELKTLPGIGDAEANKIIKGRPYLSKADLVTENVLPEGVYLSIRKLIVAKQSGKPKSSK